jgi:DNA-binding transcriptional regulator YhcF (GntR family)
MLMRREIYKLNLPHRAVAVYMYLRDRADKFGECFPSVKTISKDLKMSERTVQRAFRDLEKEGLIKCEKRLRNNGSQSSNLFRMT